MSSDPFNGIIMYTCSVFIQDVYMHNQVKQNNSYKLSIIGGYTFSPTTATSTTTPMMNFHGQGVWYYKSVQGL